MRTESWKLMPSSVMLEYEGRRPLITVLTRQFEATPAWGTNRLLACRSRSGRVATCACVTVLDTSPVDVSTVWTAPSTSMVCTVDEIARRIGGMEVCRTGSTFTPACEYRANPATSTTRM